MRRANTPWRRAAGPAGNRRSSPSRALHIELAAVEPALAQIAVAHQEIQRPAGAPALELFSVRVFVELQEQSKVIWIGRIAEHIEIILLYQARPAEQFAEPAIGMQVIRNAVMPYGVAHRCIARDLLLIRQDILHDGAEWIGQVDERPESECAEREDHHQ